MSTTKEINDDSSTVKTTKIGHTNIVKIEPAIYKILKYFVDKHEIDKTDFTEDLVKIGFFGSQKTKVALYNDNNEESTVFMNEIRVIAADLKLNKPKTKAKAKAKAKPNVEISDDDTNTTTDAAIIPEKDIVVAEPVPVLIEEAIASETEKSDEVASSLPKKKKGDGKKKAEKKNE